MKCSLTKVAIITCATVAVSIGFLGNSETGHCLTAHCTTSPVEPTPIPAEKQCVSNTVKIDLPSTACPLTSALPGKIAECKKYFEAYLTGRADDRCETGTGGRICPSGECVSDGKGNSTNKYRCVPRPNTVTPSVTCQADGIKGSTRVNCSGSVTVICGRACEPDFPTPAPSPTVKPGGTKPTTPSSPEAAEGDTY